MNNSTISSDTSFSERHDTDADSFSERHDTDADYELLLARLRERFAAVTADPTTKLFRTASSGLFDAFLAGLPAGDTRQHYTCNTCRSFFNHFGGLVTIGEDGRTEPALWGFEAPMTFAASVGTVHSLVRAAKVTGVFLSGKYQWGTPMTGKWSHIHVIPVRHLIVSERKLTAGQQMAEKAEEYGMLRRGLADFSRDVVAKAVTLLKTDALYRSEKCLGVAEWLLGLHESIATYAGTRRTNIVWRAVASAPAGWCHVRSSMIGSLLEDLASGMNFDLVSKSFAEKMHPLRYQRPTAAPSEGNIDAAEKLFEKLGLASALERRFARLDEIETIWKPKEARTTPANGVFGHLRGSRLDPSTLAVPEQTITFVKFRDTVLPNAERIQIRVPSHGDFVASVTAVNPDAPPILQWDREERRNPVSRYVYNGGSYAMNWGLTAGVLADITAVSLSPWMWYGLNLPNHMDSAMFVIKGAVDQRDGGLGLFPETLRSELHEVRSTIEAFSRRGKIQGRENASACGIEYKSTFLVKMAGSDTTVNYRIDRWD
jgi:hypothetical protein